MHHRPFVSLITCIVITVTIPVLESSGAALHNQPGKTGQAQTTIPGIDGYFAGSINGKYPFTMVLYRTDSIVCGSYAYDKHKTGLALFGKYYGGSTFTLREYADQISIYDRESSTGLFKSTIAGDSIYGTWSNKDSSKSFPFRAKRFVPDKKTILTDAIGEYRLTHVEGSFGANGMFDYYPAGKGKWTAEASSISGNMREPNDLTITSQDNAVLNSFKVSVNNDVSVTLFASGKTLIRIPFNSTGMYYNIVDKNNERAIYADTTYKSSRTFFKDRLAIGYQDFPEFSSQLSMSNDFMLYCDEQMILNYLPLEHTFELRFGYVFEINTLTFK